MNPNQVALNQATACKEVNRTSRRLHRDLRQQTRVNMGNHSHKVTRRNLSVNSKANTDNRNLKAIFNLPVNRLANLRDNMGPVEHNRSILNPQQVLDLRISRLAILDQRQAHSHRYQVKDNTRAPCSLKQILRLYMVLRNSLRKHIRKALSKVRAITLLEHIRAPNHDLAQARSQVSNLLVILSPLYLHVPDKPNTLVSLPLLSRLHHKLLSKFKASTNRHLSRKPV